MTRTQGQRRPGIRVLPKARVPAGYVSVCRCVQTVSHTWGSHPSTPSLVRSQGRGGTGLETQGCSLTNPSTQGMRWAGRRARAHWAPHAWRFQPQTDPTVSSRGCHVTLRAPVAPRGSRLHLRTKRQGRAPAPGVPRGLGWPPASPRWRTRWPRWQQLALEFTGPENRWKPGPSQRHGEPQHFLLPCVALQAATLHPPDLDLAVQGSALWIRSP